MHIDQGDKYRRFIARNAAGQSDVYDVLRAFNVTDPALQHALKKMLLPGKRGGKTIRQDLQEAQVSLTNAINAIPKGDE